jgi:hypothetical protein
LPPVKSFQKTRRKPKNVNVSVLNQLPRAYLAIGVRDNLFSGDL